MAFLRARFPDTGDVAIEVGGKPLTTPWLSLLAASDLSILPTELAYALQGNSATSEPQQRRGDRARRPRARDGARISGAAGGARFHDARQRETRGPPALCNAGPGRGSTRSRRAQSLVDGSDRLGELHPVCRRDPLDAVRRGHHRTLRLGGKRGIAARHGERRGARRGTHPAGGVSPGDCLSRTLQALAAGLGLGYSRLAGARRYAQPSCSRSDGMGQQRAAGRNGAAGGAARTPRNTRRANPISNAKPNQARDSSSTAPRRSC